MVKVSLLVKPLTRSRAGQPGNVPTRLNACYYDQRASAALIIAEATQVSMQGRGYAWTPGIHSREQVAGWREVTDAVRRWLDLPPALACRPHFPSIITTRWQAAGRALSHQATRRSLHRKRHGRGSARSVCDSARLGNRGDAPHRPAIRARR